MPGLEKRVTYSETKIPLGDLIAKVAADTGVRLTAARDVTDEPVAVVVKEFSARELLEQLADLLDYQWSRRQKRERTRFEIYQDLASKKREQALRQALFAEMERRFQEGITIARDLAGKSQEEMQRLWDERARWREQLRKLPSLEQQALQDSPEGQRYGWVDRMWSPITRSLARWTLHMPPEQWAALRAGRLLTYSSDPRRGELSLPPEVLRIFRTTRPILAPPRQPEEEEAQRREEDGRQTRWAQADIYRVTVRFGEEDPAPVRMQLQVAARPFKSDGSSLYPNPRNRYEGFGVGVWGGNVIATAVEDPERRALLEQDPVLSVKKPFQADSREYPDLVFPGAAPRARLLSEFLPDLARAYGMNFIADSYAYSIRPFGGEGRRSVPRESYVGPPPLFGALDHLAGLYHAWDRRGNLVRIRYRNWFLARPTEIPMRLVRRWLSVSDRLGALPLSEFASFAVTLTDFQIPLLGDRWAFPPQLDDLRRGNRGDLEQSRYLLRLYARLSPGQQQALWDGKSLSIARLAPSLQPLVLTMLNRIARTLGPEMDLEPWEGGQITFARRPDVRIRERRGHSVTYRLESEAAPPSTTRPDEVTRFPVTHLEMRIQYGPQAWHALRLIVAGRSAPPE